MNIKNIVAFLALMQNDNGLIDKSESYILEKFNRYCLTDEDRWQCGLDIYNEERVAAWIKRWKK